MLAAIRDAIEAQGLAYRGAFHPDVDDMLSWARTLVLLGFDGRQGWDAFAASSEARDGEPNGLDRWSRRVVGALATAHEATALFPFNGPPWLPFQRWAQKAEPLHPSPLGMLVHPDWGLWHSWRGALAFTTRFDLPPPDIRSGPCETCVPKPCLSACPVAAFGPAGYDVKRCVDHLDRSRGADCMDGCPVRRACPVGRAHRYSAQQAGFHMRAFRGAQRRDAPSIRPPIDDAL
ncbi:MAG: hypothetical protein KGJ78_11830 [Alphaproteobacteria bacterium]|nr:hypothetical protein [Alphaproteobacteria bacterium]